MVSRNGARWSKSGSSSRGPTSGVPESLVFSGKGSPGSTVLERDLAVARERGSDLLGGAGDDPPRLAARRVDRPDVEAAAGERARGVGEQEPVAAPGGHRDDLVATRQPLQAAAVAADDVEAGRALAAVLADEGDPAPVGRPVRLGVGPVRRDRALADVEVAVARGDDELREAAGGCRVSVPGQAGKQRQRRERHCDQEKPSSARHASVCCPTGADGRPVPSPNASRALGERGHRPDADVLAVEELQPVVERAGGERRRELRAELLLRLGVEVALRELRAADHLAEPDEELRLERADGEPAAVGGRVDPVAGEAAREEARQRIAAEPVRDEPVGAVSHRDRQPRAAAGALALEHARRAPRRRRRALRRRGRRAAAAAARAPCPRARPPSRGS